MKQNPYTLVFGKEPNQMIRRVVLSDEILNAFSADDPIHQIYMISGVRGSGKTVFMTEISNILRKRKNWVVIELNPERDLLTSLAAKLNSNSSFAKIFRNAKINLSFLGLGLEIENTSPITDIEIALCKMLESLKKQNKRVLITIDEVSSTKTMREFAASFQIFLRQNLPVYLIMTGLFENIDELQNEQNLTFLYRAPKIRLNPLDSIAIRDNYKENFQISDQEASDMADLTKGYSFAFQVLGYLTWQNGGNYKKSMLAYGQYLREYSYEKIWAELSKNDKKIARGIALTASGSISDIRIKLKLKTNEFSPYRARLIKKGLVDGSEYGFVHFVLPLFDQFVLDKQNLY